LVPHYVPHFAQLDPPLLIDSVFTVFDVHDLIEAQVGQRNADRRFSSSGSRIGARQDRDRYRHASEPCEAQLCSGVFLKARAFSSRSVR
jgi:hypothetical protein